MIREFYEVILVDFSGVLPFKLEKEDIFTKQGIVATKNLEKFILDLESSLNYEFIYVGSDLLEAKLFHRLIAKEGLLELLIGTPITLIAHFKEKKQADQFKISLENILTKILPDIMQQMLVDSIEIKKVKKEIVAYEQERFKKLGVN